MAKSIWRTLAEALAIPPIYAPIRPSDESLAAGWKLAYEAEKERRMALEDTLNELLPDITEEDRDEFARLIADKEPDNWAARLPRSPVKYFARKDADRLIALGYRKVIR